MRVPMAMSPITTSRATSVTIMDPLCLSLSGYLPDRCFASFTRLHVTKVQTVPKSRRIPDCIDAIGLEWRQSISKVAHTKHSDRKGRHYYTALFFMVYVYSSGGPCGRQAELPTNR